MTRPLSFIHTSPPAHPSCSTSPLQSLSEPWADTTSHAGKMIMTIFAGIAEFEQDLIRERTGAGREAAKKRGVLFGRPPKLTPDQRELARRLGSEGKSVREIASVFNVHAATIYRLAHSTTGMANRPRFGASHDPFLFSLIRMPAAEKLRDSPISVCAR